MRRNIESLLLAPFSGGWSVGRRAKAAERRSSRSVFRYIVGSDWPLIVKNMLCGTSLKNAKKIGAMKGVFALRAYQPRACRVYPPAAAP